MGRASDEQTNTRDAPRKNVKQAKPVFLNPERFMDRKSGKKKGRERIGRRQSSR